MLDAVNKGTPDSGWRELVERYRAAVAPQGIVDYIP